MDSLLRAYALPSGSMSFYGVKANGDTDQLVGLHIPISSFVQRYDSLVVRPDRNIDYLAILNKVRKVARCENAVAEYSFTNAEMLELQHHELSQEDCRNYVANEVDAFLDQYLHDFGPDEKIVVGISGGGDSNTLLRALTASGKIKAEQLRAVMMLGVPDWDKGIDRARELCVEHGVSLEFVDARTVGKLMNKSNPDSWIEDFEKIYPDSDVEVIGTYAIRLALSYVAEKIDARGIVIGLNLEDLLAESLFVIMQGNLPRPFPIRKIAEFSYWYPLYRLPKRILDGCNPKFSLQNYQDRYPSRMVGRAIPYYLAQMFYHILPGSEFDLLKGIQQLSQLNQAPSFPGIDELQPTYEPVDEMVIAQWSSFLSS